MTQDEAVKIMIDVATQRAPHNRGELKEALSILEPAEQAPAKKPAKTWTSIGT
jgi:hypothetical protein